jgi:hypothetical protein
MAACLVCGRSVRFNRKRAAAYSHDIHVAIAALRVAEAAIGDELDGEPFLRVVREGQDLLETMHDWAHAVQAPRAADARATMSRLDRWRRNVNMFIRAWASYDRTSYQEHLETLPHHEERFVRSIAAGSVA